MLIRGQFDQEEADRASGDSLWPFVAACHQLKIPCGRTAEWSADSAGPARASSPVAAASFDITTRRLPLTSQRSRHDNVPNTRERYKSLQSLIDTLLQTDTLAALTLKPS